MQLLIIRHGAAEEVGPDSDDSRRALTKAGAREMEMVGAGLRTMVEQLEAIAASPLLRAQQTAAIVSKAFGDLPVQTVPALVPGSELSALLDWLSQYESAEVVAIVGHEPHVGTLTTWLMTGAGNSRIAFSKGGAALLEFESRLAAGRGTLEWLLKSSQLRRLGQ
jgi:phosphohistidine phosphatase